VLVIGLIYDGAETVFMLIDAGCHIVVHSTFYIPHLTDRESNDLHKSLSSSLVALFITSTKFAGLQM